MTRISREPAITRAKTSRPTLSVPNQCALESPVSEFSPVAYGLCVKCDPKSAAQIQKSRISAPATNVFEASSRRKVVSRRSDEIGRDRGADGTSAVSAPGSRQAGLRQRAHCIEYRIRGFRSAYIRSAMIVATRYTTPIVSTADSSIGKSLPLAAL